MCSARPCTRQGFPPVGLTASRRALLPHDFTVAPSPFRGEGAVYFLLHSPSLINFFLKGWALPTACFPSARLRRGVFGLSSTDFVRAQRGYEIECPPKSKGRRRARLRIKLRRVLNFVLACGKQNWQRPSGASQAEYSKNLFFVKQSKFPKTLTFPIPFLILKRFGLFVETSAHRPYY